MSGYTLCVIGAGTMGVAILSGVLEAKKEVAVSAASANSAGEQSLASSLTEEELHQLPDRFLACVNRRETGKSLRKTLDQDGYSDVEVVVQQNVQAAQRADVVLLSVKPHLLSEIMHEPGMKEALDGKLVISIAAGVRIEQMRAWVTERTKVVRAMPNTASKIREGMTVLTPLPPASDGSASKLDRAILLSIFTAVGRALFLEEKHFDASTALAGSGPAFACVFMEAMTDGGVMMGLPRAAALELAAQSMQGAARMVLQSGIHPAALKDSVTSTFNWFPPRRLCRGEFATVSSVRGEGGRRKRCWPYRKWPLCEICMPDPTCTCVYWMSV